jgi:hypothetical protein
VRLSGVSNIERRLKLFVTDADLQETGVERLCGQLARDRGRRLDKFVGIHLKVSLSPR